jgi:hypothetical protein
VLKLVRCLTVTEFLVLAVELACAVWVSASAPARYRGRIIDCDTKRPLSHVRVSFDSAFQRGVAFTDQDGYYEVEEIPDPPHRGMLFADCGPFYGGYATEQYADEPCHTFGARCLVPMYPREFIPVVPI